MTTMDKPGTELLNEYETKHLGEQNLITSFRSYERECESGEKFICGLCEKQFVLKNSLHMHFVSYHNGEEMYRCPLCGKNFGHAPTFKHHYRRHIMRRAEKQMSRKRQLDVARSNTPQTNSDELLNVSTSTAIDKNLITDAVEMFDDLIRPETTRNSFNQREEHYDKSFNNLTSSNLCSYMVLENEDTTSPSASNDQTQTADSDELLNDIVSFETRRHRLNQEDEQLEKATLQKPTTSNSLDLLNHLNVIIRRQTDPRDQHFTNAVHIPHSNLQTSNRSEETKPSSSDMFICGFCLRKFVRKNQLDMHFLSDHNGKEKYGCPRCGKNFEEAISFKRHFRIHIRPREETWKKRQFDAVMANNEQFTKPSHQHANVESEVRNQNEEPDKTQSEKSLSSENDETWKCIFCSFQSENIQLLHRHIFSSHKSFNKDNLPTQSSGNNNPPTQSSGRGNQVSIKCSVCYIEFMTVSEMQTHAFMSHTFKPTETDSFFRCMFCLRRFKCLSTLKIHNLAIHSAKERSCFICKFVCKNFSDLENHIMFDHKPLPESTT